MYEKKRSPPPEVRKHQRSESSPYFEELAARLESIGSRALEQGWRGWRPEDAEVVGTAAREIRAVPEALATGMRDAFSVGRRYGRGEEELAELNTEIDALSRRLARQAWGGGRSGLA